MTLLAAADGLVNASAPLPWLLVSGQPTGDQIRALRAAGLATIIDIRESMEPRTIDEPAAAAEAGVAYVNAPVVSGALTDKGMERVLQALVAARGTPTLLHCNSANRTGGPLIAYLMLHEGFDEQAAVDAAMRGGMRSVEIMEWATEYVGRNRN